MTGSLKIFTDGSYNHHTKIIGWGYVIVSENTVLYADNGHTQQIKNVPPSNMAEHLAVIHALIALPVSISTITMMIDEESVAGLVNGQQFRYQRSQEIGRLRNIIRQLCSTLDIKAKGVRSGKHPFNKYADTLARAACGLPRKFRPNLRQRRALRLIKEVLS